jgi:hypothetical protein
VGLLYGEVRRECDGEAGLLNMLSEHVHKLAVTLDLAQLQPCQGEGGMIVAQVAVDGHDDHVSGEY